LIQRKPINRLGLDGPKEVKEHPWLKDYPWQKLYNKELDPPFVSGEDFDIKQTLAAAEGNWEDESDEIVKQNTLLLRRNSVQSLFNGYHYDMMDSGSVATVGIQNNLQKQMTYQSSSGSFNANNSSQTTQTLSVSIDNK